MATNGTNGVNGASKHRDLNICIAGAGMGGLTCALALAKRGFTNINVYETASNLGFVGAGIQMAPNMARILDRLGCWDDIWPDATDIKEASIRQHDTEKELSHVMMPHIREEYGYPHMVGHRSKLAGGIFDNCKRQDKAVNFFWRSTISKVVAFTP
ncbi:hypothetical protein LTS18_005763, partial [Coniosporium uncinatum]